MWLALAFLSAFLLGCYEVNKKMSLNGNAVIPVLFFNTLISSLIFVPFILLSFYTDCLDGTMVYVPRASLEDHLKVLIKAVIVLSSWISGDTVNAEESVKTHAPFIGVFCLETFAADDNRADQGQPARAYITGCDASVRGTAESISMGRSLAFYRFLLSPFLIGEERGDSFCP